MKTGLNFSFKINIPLEKHSLMILKKSLSSFILLPEKSVKVVFSLSPDKQIYL